MSTAAAAGTVIFGELEVHRLGFGAMRITGDGVWGPPADRCQAVAVLRRAVDLGVNFIDTAESYGPHVSEELIAEALYPYPRGLVVATKGGFDRPGPGQWRATGQPSRLRQELEGSLRRLKVDRIDLWQLHRIDPAVPEAEQFGAIQEFLTEGKIRNVGLSEVSTDQIDRARQAFPVVSVQNRYNLAERQADPVLDYCEGNQIAFIPWYPLLAGTLDQRAQGGGALASIADAHGATPMQIAIAWLLGRSSVMLPIPGTSRVDHLDENVAAAAIKLSPDEMSRLG